MNPDASVPASWTLRLTYDRLPLSLNDRDHWAKVAAAKRLLRDQVRVLTRAQRIPRLERIHVQLHWTPAVRRKRDADNLMLVHKVCVDGTRDAPAVCRNGRIIRPAWTGIVADDDPAHVQWSPPIIHPPVKGLTERIVLVITDLATKEQTE